MLQILLLILSIILCIGGILGAIIPILPGPLLSFGGLLIFFFTSYSNISLSYLIIMGVLMVILSIADNFISPYFAKKAGGSKSAFIGSLIGLVMGAIFFPPFGMFIGAFIGALVGEFTKSGKIDTKEIKIAFGAFIGVLLSSGLKLIYSIWIILNIIMYWK